MKKLVVIFACMFAAPLFAFAQISISNDVSISVSPSVPEPGDLVTIELESFVIDLVRASISWSVDGTVQQEGPGSDVFELQTTKDTSSYRVSARVVASEGQTYTKEVLVRPAQVDLLWEAVDSHVPTLYKGKALNAHDGGVLVQAFPSTGTEFINPRNLIYTWTVNNKIQQSASGVGKDTFLFPGPSLYRAAFVTVDVESRDGTYRARRSINLEAQAPQILFYKNDPLLGLSLRQALDGSVVLDEDELMIRAEPYFFSDIESFSEVDYNWRVDGRSIRTLSDRNEIILRRPASATGRSSISLEIKHVGKLLQFARSLIIAEFAESDRTPSNNGDPTFFSN